MEAVDGEVRDDLAHCEIGLSSHRQDAAATAIETAVAKIVTANCDTVPMSGMPSRRSPCSNPEIG